VETKEELSTIEPEHHFCIRWRYKTRRAHVPSYSDINAAIACSIKIYTISGLCCTDADEVLDRLAPVLPALVHVYGPTSSSLSFI
jgi:hypothetical protein